MDFNLHGSDKPPKRGSPDSFGYDDHSPNTDDFLHQPHHKMNTSDDFEHIHSDKLLDTDYDLLGTSGVNAPQTTQSSKKQNLIDDFSFNDNGSPNFGTPAHHKTATIDFMQAERGGPFDAPKVDSFSTAFNTAPPAAVPPPSPPKKTSSLLEGIEDDYMNPYATSMKPEPIIPSEKDILKDIEEPEIRMKTPDLFYDEISPAIHQAEMQKIPDFGARPVKPVDPPPPAPTPARRDESPAPPLVSESVKRVEPVEQPKKVEPKPEPVKPVEQPKKIEPIAPKAEPAKKPEAAVRKTKEQLTSAEEIFCRFGLDAWFKPERLHPKVESLIYWRDVKKSGAVFAAGLILLLAISFFSVISVVAYASLAVLLGTVSFRIYKTVLQAVQKTSDGHPFKEYLDTDLVLPQEKVQDVVLVSVNHVNAFLAELRRLFLVEDLVDSLKFGLLLWALTYLGSWFNGITLVVLAYVALFTLPKVYENNKESIDTYLGIVRSKFLEIAEKVKTAVPIGKKQESDKEKTN